MANILIFSETTAQSVKTVTLEILGKLADSGHTLEVATVGQISSESKQQLAQYGASHIYSMTGSVWENYSPEGYTQGLHNFIKSKSFDYVFTGATSLGKDFFPRLAGSFDAGMVSEVIDFTMEENLFKGIRPLFAGKCLAKVEIKGPRPHFITIRPNALGLPDSTTPQEIQEEEITSTDNNNIRAIIKKYRQRSF